MEEQTQKTIAFYCNYIGWNVAELARQAGIDRASAQKAMNGNPVSSRIKREICSALTSELKRDIKPGDVVWETTTN